MKVLSFGEILWDIYPDKKYIGGAPFNFAAHLAKHREEAYMLSCLGKDALGDEAMLRLEALGVLTGHITRIERKPTGQCIVTLGENAVPHYDLKTDVAYDHIDCTGVDGEFDVLYFGTLALRGEYNLRSLRELIAKKHFKEVFADVNIRAPFYSKESVGFAVKNATILKISEEELSNVKEILTLDGEGYKELASDIGERYENLKLIVITLGEKGAYCLDCKSKAEYVCGAQKVTAASTVGAGDSFCAAFLHQLFKGADLQRCLEYASRVAAYVVSQYDAVPDYDADDFK